MKPIRLAIFISGSGTTYQAVHDSCEQRGGLKDQAKVNLVVASRSQAPGVQKAIANGMTPEKNLFIFRPKDFSSEEEFGETIIKTCRQRDIDLILQLGWMIKTPANVIKAYRNHILNQHPGPLEFGGQGMYGVHVHAAVLKFNELTSRANTWATVHLADERYDHGQIIKEWPVPTYPNDTPEKLAERVLPAEHELVKRVIWEYALNQKLPKIKRAAIARTPIEKNALKTALEYGKNYGAATGN